MSALQTDAEREYNARPDTLDFRDKIYVPNLYEVPTQIDLEEYKYWKVPILDQGREGACTGFGLATVANYLLRRRKVVPDPNRVSPRMLYEMARRYDEWPGEDYSGSSARGAMKGWHKHGICGDDCWPYESSAKNERLTEKRTSDARKRPLGAYYRVNHKDLVAMHTAMAEVGILYATASVHTGWKNVGTNGVIEWQDQKLGGHAFAIVAYDENGFWIQNSWGETWGKDGFGLISYDDWLMNGSDVWVARLGAPVMLSKPQSIAISNSATSGKSNAYAFSELRPHIISIGNDGKLNGGGSFGTSAEEVETIFMEDFREKTADWSRKRLLLYAHGGLVGEDAAVQQLADYRPALLDAQVYPVSFIWHTDFWTTTTNILQDALKRRRPEGILDSSKDFMLDRLDDALEPVARLLMGKMQWGEMKENGLLATNKSNGGARIALQYIAELAKDPKVEIHVVGHSAGSIFHAPLIQAITTELKLKIESCALWAPACTVKLFKEAYLPAINSKKINRFALYTLTDEAEQDDNCAKIYNKSLLYLVSNAFENKPRIPLFRDGEPILGMAKFVMKDPELAKLFKSKNADWVQSPNNEMKDPKSKSTSRHHGDFDNDRSTVESTLARILDSSKPDLNAELIFTSSASSNLEKRQQLMK
ncbi:C1 family peptidase [Larkinella terrae]|uniref:Peptidase C1 n=1 Tax=Larkinella terrae TaxID=2025311 RepID=A0A7K0ELI8_9BACT|nr:C1 family peptidase [Larkinella terrae]MRS62720.1 peptidase C1 [Larkinella terrae]